MSDHLTPERLQELRANTLKELPWEDFDAIFTHIDQQAETIRRLRAERRVTKGLHAKIDEQAATIQRVRVLHAPFDVGTGVRWCTACIGPKPDENIEAEYPCPTILALDGGQE